MKPEATDPIKKPLPAVKTVKKTILKSKSPATQIPKSDSKDMLAPADEKKKVVKKMVKKVVKKMVAVKAKPPVIKEVNNEDTVIEENKSISAAKSPVRMVVAVKPMSPVSKEQMKNEEPKEVVVTAEKKRVNAVKTPVGKVVVAKVNSTLRDTMEGKGKEEDKKEIKEDAEAEEEEADVEEPMEDEAEQETVEEKTDQEATQHEHVEEVPMEVETKLVTVEEETKQKPFEDEIVLDTKQEQVEEEPVEEETEQHESKQEHVEEEPTEEETEEPDEEETEEPDEEEQMEEMEEPEEEETEEPEEEETEQEPEEEEQMMEEKEQEPIKDEETEQDPVKEEEMDVETEKDPVEEPIEEESEQNLFEKLANEVAGEEWVEDEEAEEGEEDEEEDEAEGEEEPEAEGDEQTQISDMAKVRKIRKQHEVFVGGLDRDAVEDDLKKVFEKVGEVLEIRLHREFKTNKNKGFAFVKLANKEQVAKALTELKSPMIRGKRCGVVPSDDNDTLFLGNICNTWTKEAIKTKLLDYGIANVENINLVEDASNKALSRGFAFLEFACHADALHAYKRLEKPDAVFGHHERSAKVAFAEPIQEPDPEVMAQIKSVFLDGLPPYWDEDRVMEHFKGYGEIERVILARNMTAAKRKDFGFVNFTTHEAAVACIEGVNNTELCDGQSKIKVKARLANPQPKAQAVKGAMSGGHRIGHTGFGAYSRAVRGYPKAKFPSGVIQHGRGLNLRVRGRGSRSLFFPEGTERSHSEVHERQHVGNRGGRVAASARGGRVAASARGGRVAAFARGGRGAAFARGGRGAAFARGGRGAASARGGRAAVSGRDGRIAAPVRGGAFRGRGRPFFPRRQPYALEEDYPTPYNSRYVDEDPYAYIDGQHGVKRPYAMMEHDPDYLEVGSRLRPRYDHPDSVADRYRGSSGRYSRDYYDSDYGEGSYSYRYGGDQAGRGYYD